MKNAIKTQIASDLALVLSGVASWDPLASMGGVDLFSLTDDDDVDDIESLVEGIDHYSRALDVLAALPW